jgi:lysophospholipase L1-like esterase
MQQPVGGTNMNTVHASFFANRRWLRAARHSIALSALLVAVSLAPASGAAVNPATAPPTNRLVILGASYAGSWGTPPLPGYAVVNRGVGGEQTKGMRARFQNDVIAAQPKAVLIWGHINNITQTGVGDAAKLAAVRKAAQDDYLWMLQQARAAGIEVILATEVPLAEPTGLVNGAVAFLNGLRGKQSYATQVNREVRELNAFVKQLAAREKLVLLEFDQVFAPEGGARKPEYAKEDRSHVTPAGYEALTAYAVAEFRERR